MDKFDKAEALRNSIVAHLRENPGQSTRQTADTLKLTIGNVARAMRAMALAGELAALGEGRNVTYTVLADSAYNAKAARELAVARRTEARKKGEATRRHPNNGKEPWRHVHTPTMAIPNQGGQGAVPRHGSIKSCADL